jgi:surface polysaccharide O-acyltransferase-like enzyme
VDLLTRPTRLASIESYRVVAILIVVFIHSSVVTRLHTVGGGYGFIVDLPLYLVFWTAVPYFFLVAGYFYGRKVDAGADPLQLLRQSCASLGLIFIIWVLVYSVVGRSWITQVYHHGIWGTFAAEAIQTLSRVRGEHIKLLLIPRPPIYHLWFLPSLMLGLGTAAVVVTHHLAPVALRLVAGLYVLSVGCGLLPLDVLQDYPPAMLLLGMLFTLLGWWISQQQVISAGAALRLMAGGVVLAFVEGAVLKKLIHASTHQVVHYPYAGAVLLVLGVFLLMLANPTWGQRTILPRLARFTLGVYVSHILIEHTLAPVHDQLPHLSIIWHLFYALAVYGFAVLFTWGLTKIPGMRLAVTR